LQRLLIRDLRREDRGLYQCLASGLNDQLAMDSFQLDLGGEQKTTANFENMARNLKFEIMARNLKQWREV
jgi:hypothetical protein